MTLANLSEWDIVAYKQRLNKIAIVLPSDAKSVSEGKMFFRLYCRLAPYPSLHGLGQAKSQ